MQKVEISNVRAIEQLELPIPEDGGIVVLRGRNGAGKSSALGAVETALRGSGSLDVRDGSANGKVEGLGVKITVGRRTRVSGELEVESLEGKLSLSDLIDPGQKSADAADSRRIKALCALAGAKPQINLFARLLEKPEFERIISTEAETADDLVVMADRVKRDIEKEARQVEDMAIKYEGKALGLRNAAGDVGAIDADLINPDLLQSRLEFAITTAAKLQEKQQAYAAAKLKQEEARKFLEQSGAKWEGPTMAEIDNKLQLLDMDLQITKASQQDNEREAVELKQRLVQLELERAKIDSKADKLAADIDVANAQKKSIVDQQEKAGEFAKIVNDALPDAVVAAEVDEALADVTIARKALETGALQRQALANSAEADKYVEQAASEREKAASLRDAAQAVDEVLSDVVQSLGTPLKVEKGRLVTQTTRGTTHFHELSPGERAAMAVDIALNKLGESGGVFVLDQVIFEGLDPANRKLLADHAKQRKVVILTAEAASGELRADLFGT